MNCNNYKEQLSEYLDGQLAPASAQALEAHLSGCPACRAEFEALRQTVALVNGLPRLAAPADMQAMVRNRLDAERRGSRAKILHFFARPFPRMALAAAVVLIVFVYGYLKVLPPPASDVTEPIPSNALRQAAETQLASEPTPQAIHKVQDSRLSDTSIPEARPASETRLGAAKVPVVTKTATVASKMMSTDMPADIKARQTEHGARDGDKDEILLQKNRDGGEGSRRPTVFRQGRADSPLPAAVPPKILLEPSKPGMVAKSEAPGGSIPAPVALPPAKPAEFQIHRLALEDDRLWAKGPVPAVNEPAKDEGRADKYNFEAGAEAEAVDSVSRPVGQPGRDRQVMTEKPAATAAQSMLEGKASYASRASAKREKAKSAKEEAELSFSRSETTNTLDIHLQNRDAFLELIARYATIPPINGPHEQTRSRAIYEIEIAVTNYIRFIRELEHTATIVNPRPSGTVSGGKAGDVSSPGSIRLILNIVDSPARD